MSQQENGTAIEGLPDDQAKAAKKAAKLAEKAAKKQKALEKAQMREAAPVANKKKSKAKEEAVAKKKQEEEEVAALIAEAQASPIGQKKDITKPLYRAYYPKLVEAGWYNWWKKCGFFKPDDASTGPSFTMVIPPPNVTGVLHIGHALTNAIQDAIVRWRRMSGDNVLWVPGTDHASISTQVVVEKKLKKERNVLRRDLGRDKFLAEVHAYVDEYGNRILDQEQRMGCSVDWDRYAFTMDNTRSRAVLEAFVRMHEQGCIYRDNRLVNWDCRLRTAVSDVELEYIDIPQRTLISVPGYDDKVEFGVLTSFAYPLEDGSGEVVIATTRPETMLGDTAVAVHPDDDRYRHLHGKYLKHPINGRRMPIICDAELVDMAFGTGAVKITPAHDPNDFSVGKRHNLEFVNILDDYGCINENGGDFKGQPRFKARVTVVAALRALGLFRGTADNAMRLGICGKSGDVVEPVLKPQWWVSCKAMAERACDAVRQGALEIVPRDFEAVWFRWLEAIRDWCISRQLWWGHRIPAYYVVLEDAQHGALSLPGGPSEDLTRWVIARTAAEAEAAARAQYPGHKLRLVQDEDVLDTWFSSGIFPFSVFGWPSDTSDMSRYFPTTLLETGHDILFFWVARMVMMSLQLMGELPFKTVYLHAMIRDARGRKMSKSLGNVIDPLAVIDGITLEGLHQTLTTGNLDAQELERATQDQNENFPNGIEECGTDALRIALLSYTAQSHNVNLDIKRVIGYRHWCNKLWNAVKFCLMYLPEGFVPSKELDVASMPLSSRWIISCLHSTAKDVVKALQAFDFSTAVQRSHSFWLYDFCDVFIEIVKPVLNQATNIKQSQHAQETLWYCLDWGLKLLHPFMPFVTEELWQRLPKKPGQVEQSIMLCKYPEAVPEVIDKQLEGLFQYFNDLVNKTRGLRSDYGLTKQRPHLYITCSNAEKRQHLENLSLEIGTLTSSSQVTTLADPDNVPSGCGVVIIDDVTTVHMLLQGILDVSLEIQKHEKKLADLQGRIDDLQNKMAVPSYIGKTPQAIQQENKEKLEKMKVEAGNIEQAISDFGKLSVSSRT